MALIHEVTAVLQPGLIPPPRKLTEAFDLAATDPIPEHLRPIHVDFGAQVAAALASGDPAAALATVSWRNGPVGEEVARQLIDARDRQVEALVRASAAELDKLLASAITKAADQIVAAEQVLTKTHRLNPPRFMDSGTAVLNAPVDRVRSAAAAAGVEAFAEFGRWSVAYQLHKQARGATQRLRWIGLLDGDSKAVEATKAVVPAPPGLQDRTKAADAAERTRSGDGSQGAPFNRDPLMDRLAEKRYQLTGERS